MTDPREEQWRREFELIGYTAVHDELRGACGWEEARRRAGFRWLREKELERERRGATTYRYVKWTFWAAATAVVVGIVGVVVTVCH
jgi:hypothetical protein